MGNIDPGKHGQGAILLGIEARGLATETARQAAVDRAAEGVRLAHGKCEELAARGEERAADYVRAFYARREAVRVLKDTPASNVSALTTKRDVLLELEVWVGPEDPECCAFAIQLALEAVSLADVLGHDRENGVVHRQKGHPGGPGRWLMGAAVSFPAYLVSRLGLG